MSQITQPSNSGSLIFMIKAKITEGGVTKLAQWGRGGNKIFSKMMILSLQAKLLSMFRYPYAPKGVRLYLETQKRLGKSGIRTHDQNSSEIY